MAAPHPHVQHLDYRPDIDGLRALAVVPVVFFHYFPNVVPGGFIGVDVFFVISGYLISTIIFNGLYSGSFSFSAFYARRIQRIFPALLLVLAACLAFGWLALLADEYQQLGKHVAAGAGFVSNFILWGESGYFDQSAEVKPLLHLWSLAIEEQFYIVFPVILWALWRLKLPTAMVLGLLAATSFALNIQGITSNATAAFYSPQTRFWELLCGSLLAWFSLRRGAGSNSRPWLPHLVSVAGIALLLYGFWGMDQNTPFPGAWALVPVAGAMLLIGAGTQAWPNRVLLSAPALVWVGVISFPLYLWHWPLLALARIIESATPSLPARLAGVALSVGLAWVTWRLVERPVRLGGASNTKVPLLLALALAIGSAGYVVYQQEGLGARSGIRQHLQNTAQFTVPEFKENRQRCQRLMGGNYPGDCLLAGDEVLAAKLQYIVIGDSHGGAFAAGSIAAQYQDAFLMLGQGGCLPLLGVERFTTEGAMHCQNTYGPAFDLLQQHRPSNATVFLVGRFAAYVNGTGFGDLKAEQVKPGHLHVQAVGPRIEKTEGLYPDTFRQGLLNTLAAISGQVKNVVIVLQVPELGFDPKSCVARPYRPLASACQLPRTDVLQRQQPYRAIVAEVAQRFANVQIYDPLDVFCDPATCHAVRGGVLYYRDPDHISLQGSQAVWDDMRRQNIIGAKP